MTMSIKAKQQQDIYDIAYEKLVNILNDTVALEKRVRKTLNDLEAALEQQLCAYPDRHKSRQRMRKL